jgi:hypothetical protein
VASGIVVAVLVFPLNAQYRDLLRPGGPTGRIQAPVDQAPQFLQSAVGSTVDQLTTDPAGYVGEAFGSATRRLRYIDSVAAVFAYHERAQRPYAPPSEFVRASAALLVPRAIWPDKPSYTFSLMFTEEYLGVRGVQSASAVTVPGDAFRYGGYAALVSVMLLVGALYRFLDGVFDHRRSAIALAAYTFMLPMFVKAEADLVSTLVGAIRGFLFLVPALWWLSGRVSLGRRRGTGVRVASTE